MKNYIMARIHPDLCDEIIDLQSEARKNRKRLTQAQASRIIAQAFKKRKKNRIPNDSILGF